jgi:hypothetical protein
MRKRVPGDGTRMPKTDDWRTRLSIRKEMNAFEPGGSVASIGFAVGDASGFFSGSLRPGAMPMTTAMATATRLYPGTDDNTERLSTVSAISAVQCLALRQNISTYNGRVIGPSHHP